MAGLSRAPSLMPPIPENDPSASTTPGLTPPTSAPGLLPSAPVFPPTAATSARDESSHDLGMEPTGRSAGLESQPGATVLNHDHEIIDDEMISKDEGAELAAVPAGDVSVSSVDVSGEPSDETETAPLLADSPASAELMPSQADPGVSRYPHQDRPESSAVPSHADRAIPHASVESSAAAKAVPETGPSGQPKPGAPRTEQHDSVTNTDDAKKHASHASDQVLGELSELEHPYIPVEDDPPSSDSHTDCQASLAEALGSQSNLSQPSPSLYPGGGKTVTELPRPAAATPSTSAAAEPRPERLSPHSEAHEQAGSALRPSPSKPSPADRSMHHAETAKPDKSTLQESAAAAAAAVRAAGRDSPNTGTTELVGNEVEEALQSLQSHPLPDSTWGKDGEHTSEDGSPSATVTTHAQGGHCPICKVTCCPAQKTPSPTPSPPPPPPPSHTPRPPKHRGPDRAALTALNGRTAKMAALVRFLSCA